MVSRSQVLLIGGEKGGVGKSTLATNIAVGLSDQGADVLIIDTDPQKTSINWVDRRNQLINSNNGIRYSRVHGISKEGNVRETIQDLSIRYDVIIIDASGRDSKSLRTALTISDKFYCPIKASQADLETLPHICELIEAAKDINADLQSIAIISMAPTNPMINEVKEAENLLMELKEHLKLSSVFIRERKVYRDALLEGKGVVEFTNQKAKDEIQQLLKEICNE